MVSSISKKKKKNHTNSRTVPCMRDIENKSGNISIFIGFVQDTSQTSKWLNKAVTDMINAIKKRR